MSSIKRKMRQEHVNNTQNTVFVGTPWYSPKEQTTPRWSLTPFLLNRSWRFLLLKITERFIIHVIPDRVNLYNTAELIFLWLFKIKLCVDLKQQHTWWVNRWCFRVSASLVPASKNPSL